MDLAFCRQRGAASWTQAVLGLLLLLGSTARAWSQQATAVSPPDMAPCMDAGAGQQTFTRWEVLKGSVCGVPDEKREWTPLYLTNFLEGWDEPRIGAPNGSSGVLRQGWINTFDGFFPRSWNLLYTFTDHLPDGRDAQLGQFQLVTPLSRRLFIEIDGPTVDGLGGEQGTPSRAGLGDTFLIPRVMLHETQNLSVSAGLGIHVPTGDPALGGGFASLFPLMTFWSDVGGGWSIRGGTGIDIPTGRSPTTDAVYFSNLAVGQVLTSHEAAPLGDFVYYLSMNSRTTLGSGESTFVSLTPGMRTYVGHNIYLLAGYEVPVTGPRPFNERFLFQFVKDF